mgnify:CR=1
MALERVFVHRCTPWKHEGEGTEGRCGKMKNASPLEAKIQKQQKEHK